MWVVIIGLSGCWEPTETGPHGMVGRITANGEPAQGIAVESLEARSITDSKGVFTVQYKPPDQLVHFQIEQLWFQRVYQPEDLGKSIEIGVPKLVARAIHCNLTGQVALRWQYGPLQIRTLVNCSTGEVMPVKTPETTPILDSPSQQLVVEGEQWSIVSQ